MSTNNTKAFETYESEVRSYCRNFPTVFVKAKGSIQTDENGSVERVEGHPSGYDRVGLS